MRISDWSSDVCSSDLCNRRLGVRYSLLKRVGAFNRPGKDQDMAILIGDTAPDFTADSTEGPIHFYDYIDGHWAVLFSHPKNFTPVCTTELGYTAKLKPEFDKRGVKVLGLSVDKLEDHRSEEHTSELQSLM